MLKAPETLRPKIARTVLLWQSVEHALTEGDQQKLEAAQKWLADHPDTFEQTQEERDVLKSLYTLKPPSKEKLFARWMQSWDDNEAYPEEPDDEDLEEVSDAWKDWCEKEAKKLNQIHASETFDVWLIDTKTNLMTRVETRLGRKAAKRWWKKWNENDRDCVCVLWPSDLKPPMAPIEPCWERRAHD